MKVQNYRFFQTIAAFDFVEEIILYGKRAGDYPESEPPAEINLAVSCPNASELEWREILETIDDQADPHLKIDCIRFDELPEDSALRHKIESEGIIILEK